MSSLVKNIKKIVEDELAKYGLTTSDLSKRELSEMIQEAKDRENPDIQIMDGYFGDSFKLMNIQMRKLIDS